MKIFQPLLGQSLNPKNENFLKLPYFSHFPDFQLEGSIYLQILGILKTTEFYKGSK